MNSACAYGASAMAWPTTRLRCLLFSFRSITRHHTTHTIRINNGHWHVGQHRGLDVPEMKINKWHLNSVFSRRTFLATIKLNNKNLTYWFWVLQAHPSKPPEWIRHIINRQWLRITINYGRCAMWEEERRKKERPSQWILPNAVVVCFITQINIFSRWLLGGARALGPRHK